MERYHWMYRNFMLLRKIYISKVRRAVGLLIFCKLMRIHKQGSKLVYDLCNSESVNDVAVLAKIF